MSVSATLTETITIGGRAVTNSVTYTSGSSLSISETIVTATTDGLVACVLDVSQIKLFYMVSNVAITVETNSASAPDNTYTLAAGVPLVWKNDGEVALADVFAADITALYVTNASGSSSTFEVYCIYDPTV